MNESKGLLVLRLKNPVTEEGMAKLMDLITPTADALGVEPMVLPPEADVSLMMDYSPLLGRLCVALEEIAGQGRAEEPNVAQNAPQALNARNPFETVDLSNVSRVYQPAYGGLNARPPKER